MKKLLVVIFTLFCSTVFSQSEPVLVKSYLLSTQKSNFYRVIPNDYLEKLSFFLDKSDTLNAQLVSFKEFIDVSQDLRLVNYKCLYIEGGKSNINYNVFTETNPKKKNKVFMIFIDHEDDKHDFLIAYVFF
jgi:hypothetical protein